MYRVDFTEPAEEDLLAALRYISDVLKAPGAASKLLSETEQQLKVLESLPRSCPLVQDEVLAMQGIRLLSVKNYLVFYVVKESEKAISIIRFLYGRRDWARALKGKDL
ncbi:MAG TPA: type II toxin-antitoxin system RelE/ParE family toxin [Treponema sp.]|nr:type II toxin-antitoxin system RelE/ParE family toxin [Treponema sp.]